MHAESSKHIIKYSLPLKNGIDSQMYENDSGLINVSIATRSARDKRHIKSSRAQHGEKGPEE